MYRSLLVCALLAVSVSCETVKDDPLSVQTAIAKMNATLQNATAILEDIFGINIPSTQDEVKTVLQDNFNELKQNAQNVQKKLDEYNVTGAAKGLVEKLQTTIDSGINDLTKDNPNLQNLVTQIKEGYSSFANVTKSIGEVVQTQAAAATTDLRALGEQAQLEITKGAKELQAKLQEVLADNQKKIKTA